jgi:hypothetical protein
MNRSPTSALVIQWYVTRNGLSYSTFEREEDATSTIVQSD